jgi:hypothetical protein
MGSVIRMADRLNRNKPASRVRPGRSTERRFQYPGPDAVSEVSCHPARPRADRPADAASGRRAG